MLMKVFNKGQVVIPADIRKELGIRQGDRLEVTTDRSRKTVTLRKPEVKQSDTLAGSLSRYGRGSPLPTRHRMNEALRKGLGNE